MIVRRDRHGFEWPRPFPDTEKWRYEEVKKCLDALDRGEVDLKQAYESSLASAAQELSNAIGSVTSINNDTLNEMKALGRKASRLWLQMGTQRCRILIFIPDSIKSPIQRNSRRGRNTELVILPEMRRIGNSQGEELDPETAVAVCKGEYSSLSAVYS